MEFAKKLFKAVQGLILYLRYSKDFNLDVLENKRIALVGPANSAYSTGRGAYIDDFDIVIRINKAPALIKEGKSKEDIGSKTNILVHSFFENDFSGGGPLNFNLFDELGIQYVINPNSTFAGKRLTFNFYKKYLLKRSTYSLPPKLYNRDLEAFETFRPTMGFCAIRMALEANFSELFITGFTFFRTPYGDGYRDALKDVEINRKHISDSKLHNPDIEYEQFKVLIGINSEKRIFVDETLTRILENDGITANIPTL